jgi:uncharacterized protein DUF3142
MARAVTLIVAALAASTLVFSLRPGAHRSDSASHPTQPQIVLWAWERPEHLEFLDPNRVGVAFLAGTIRLNGNRIVLLPRRQPLDVPAGIQLIAVVRIETGHESKALAENQLALVVSEIAKTVRQTSVSEVQIDFDARQSEHSAYRDLLFKLREELDPSVKLSITALASWCLYDNWIDDLPIDEAVPMLFRMGIDRDRVLRLLNQGGDFGPGVARHSIGISTDEPLQHAPPYRRAYVFNPDSWTATSVDDAIEKVKQLQ